MNGAIRRWFQHSNPNAYSRDIWRNILRCDRPAPEGASALGRGSLAGSELSGPGYIRSAPRAYKKTGFPPRHVTRSPLAPHTSVLLSEALTCTHREWIIGTGRRWSPTPGIGYAGCFSIEHGPEPLLNGNYSINGYAL